MKNISISISVITLALTACTFDAYRETDCPEVEPCVAEPGLYTLAPVLELVDHCQTMGLVPAAVQLEVPEDTACGELVEQTAETSEQGYDYEQTITVYADEEGLWAGVLFVSYANGTCGYQLEET